MIELRKVNSEVMCEQCVYGNIVKLSYIYVYCMYELSCVDVYCDSFYRYELVVVFFS